MEYKNFEFKTKLKNLTDAYTYKRKKMYDPASMSNDEINKVFLEISSEWKILIDLNVYVHSRAHILFLQLQEIANREYNKKEKSLNNIVKTDIIKKEDIIETKYDNQKIFATRLFYGEETVIKLDRPPELTLKVQDESELQLSIDDNNTIEI